MELTTVALVKLACLLSGQQDQEAVQNFLATLSQEQVVTVQEVQKSGVCLPAKFNQKSAPTASGMPTDDV